MPSETLGKLRETQGVGLEGNLAPLQEPCQAHVKPWLAESEGLLSVRV